jgi:hypothetical protein
MELSDKKQNRFLTKLSVEFPLKMRGVTVESVILTVAKKNEFNYYMGAMLNRIGLFILDILLS